MKPKYRNLIPHSKLIALTLCASAAGLTQGAYGNALTWDGAPDGGGSSADGKWSTGTNWVLDTAPAATGDTLTFAGTTNLTTNNDSVTALATSGTAITFASGAGSFTLSGNTLTLGSGGGGGQTIVSQQSANAQVISANINFSGGSGDRTIVFGSGAGSLTLSGNINFSNDWLFPNTTAGTIILSGNNSGDGKLYSAGGVSAGTNKMNAMMRNNVGATQLTLGSDSALGNSGSGDAGAGTANFRGIVANQQLNIGTTGGNRNLSGSSLAINANNITFNGANNLTIGNIITVGGNRDFNVTSTGAVTVSNGIFLSSDQTGRQLYCNLSGAGGMVVNGTISDTFHTGGITTTINDVAGKPSRGIFRKAGTATITLNGDSGSTFHGDFRIETTGGKVILGHDNALGPVSTTTVAATTTGDTVTSSTSLVVASTTGIAVGQTVTGDGIPTGATVTAVDTGTLTVTLSAAATADGTGVSISFSSTMVHLVRVNSGGTLDLNGHTLTKTFHWIEGTGSDGNGALINSNTGTPAAITENLPDVGSFTIGGDGDITVPRLIGAGIRTITKKGAGTFTTNGTSHNNLCGWDVQAGKVVFANTSGYGADRGVTLSGGTLQLSGANFDLINNGQSFTINSGTFDLNGKAEAVASIGGTGGTVTNTNASAATLYVGGGNAGTSTASFAGTIQDGTGLLNLTKEGTGTQTLTGTLAYSGSTTVNNGTLELQSASLNNSAAVDIKTTPGTGVLYLNYTGTDIVGDFKVDGVSQGNGTFDAVSHPGIITGSGKLQVSAPAGYSGWVSANSATGQTADQDHDNDGVSNGVEYFIGGPTGNTTGFTALPGVVTVGSTRSVTWTHAAGYTGTYNTDFFVETSTTLASGSWTTETLGVNVIITGDNVTYTFPAGPVKNFVRLRVKAN